MGPVALQICLNCAGVGLDAERLAKLVEAGSEVLWKLWWKLQERVPAAKSGTPGECGCGASFHLEAMHGGPSHRCRACGAVWLTNDQLCELAATRSDAELDGYLDTKRAPAREQARKAARALLPKMVPCPECSQPNSPADASCWACSRTLKDVCRDLRCPQCDGTMRRVQAADIELRGCDFCGGIWSADQDLKGLLYLTDARQRLLLDEIRQLVRHRSCSLRAGMPCAKCAAKTVPVSIGVLLRRPIPTCPECCGRFLDLEHLEELVLGVAV